MSTALKIKSGASVMSRIMKKVFMPLAKSLLLIPFMIAGTTDTIFAMAGPPGGGAGESQGPAAMFSSFLPLILIFVIFYFLLIRPQSKKAKEHKQLLENLKKGDKIMTNGGIYGLIEDIDGETLTLKIGVGSDLKIKMSRGHIAAIRGKE
jgi:preprotein translocase subunit YajC